MFRLLLVPLDGTAESEAALPVARAIAEATGGSIALLQAPVHATNTCAAAAVYLESVAQRIRLSSDLKVETIVRPGEAAREILAEAAARNTDLIVMCTHQSGPRSILALTSAGRWVLGHSSVPVVLVTPEVQPTHQLHSLCVPVDGTPGASIALGIAAALAQTTGAVITLIQAIVPAPVTQSLPFGTIDPTWDAEAVGAARQYGERMAQLLRESGLEAQSRVGMGDVSEQVAACADGVAADLIIMSTHATHWPSDATPSSVAEAVLHSARRPVLLVRREPRVA